MGAIRDQYNGKLIKNVIYTPGINYRINSEAKMLDEEGWTKDKSTGPREERYYRKEDDGTISIQIAPTGIMCPRGTKVPRGHGVRKTKINTTEIMWTSELIVIINRFYCYLFNYKRNHIDIYYRSQDILS